MSVIFDNNFPIVVIRISIFRQQSLISDGSGPRPGWSQARPFLEGPSLVLKEGSKPGTHPTHQLNEDFNIQNVQAKRSINLWLGMYANAEKHIFEIL